VKLQAIVLAALTLSKESQLFRFNLSQRRDHNIYSGTLQKADVVLKPILSSRPGRYCEPHSFTIYPEWIHADLNENAPRLQPR